jgi:integrase
LILQLPEEQVPKDLGQLLSWATARHAFFLPPYLLHYATGKHSAVSLPPEVWTRIRTGGKIIRERHGEESSLHDHESLRRSVLPKKRVRCSNLDEQLELLSELRNAAAPHAGVPTALESTHAVKAFIERNEDKLFPALWYLTRWVQFLFQVSQVARHYKGQGNPVAAASVLRYLSSIGQNLITVAKDLNLRELDPAQLAALYSETYELKKSDTEMLRSSQTMSRFHKFLMDRYQFPSVVFELQGKIGSPELGVDVNLLSPRGFDDLIKILKDGPGPLSRLRITQIWVATFGFRCGLRQSEALKLTIGSLQWSSRPELLIQLHRDGGTTSFKPKSRSGTRRVPLYTLLTDSELKELYRWLQQRMREDHFSLTTTLFTCSPHSSQPYDPEKVIEPIHTALRQLTGDQTLRFHHLRHSFVTWLAVRLLLPEYADVKDLFTTPDYFAQSSRKRLALSLLGNESHGQKVLHLVDLLAGHLSPDISLLHYTHLCDWLLGLAVTAPGRQPLLTEQQLISLTGLSRTTVYTNRGKTGQDEWLLETFLPKMRKRLSCSYPDPHAIRYKPADCTFLEDKDELNSERETLPSLSKMWYIFKECQENPRKIEELAVRWDLPRQLMHNWLQRARAIAAITTDKGRSRHQRLTNKTGKLHHTVRPKDPDSVNFELFPAKVESKPDIEITTRMLAAYESAGEMEQDVIRHGVSYFLYYFALNRNHVSAAS